MEPTKSINEVFHSIKYEYQIRAIDAALLNETISLRDAQLIREFIAERRSCVGISVGCSGAGTGAWIRSVQPA